MKFKPEIPGVLLSAESLEQDYTQAQQFDKVRLGEQCIFFRKFSGTTYLPYNRISRAWLRQEEVKARMCCATANFDQFYLVLSCIDGQERRGHLENKEAGQRCLDHIAARDPAVQIGFVKSQE